MKTCAWWIWVAATFLGIGSVSLAENLTNSRLGFHLPPTQEIGSIALPNPALTLLLSPDGKTLYAGDTDGLITIWNLATRLKLRELHGHAGRVTALALSRNGELLASGSSDRTAIVWDLKTGLPRPAVKFENVVLSVAFSPDSGIVLGAGLDSAIRVIKAASGEVVATFREPDAKNGYRTVAFLDQEHGAASRFPGRIVVWNLQTGKVDVSFKGEAEGTLKVDATGRWLLATPRDLSLSFWPLEEIHKAITSGDATAIPPARERAFIHRLQRLAYTSIPFDRWNFAPSGPSRAWEPSRGFTWPVAPAEPFEIVGAALSMDGTRAVISHWDRTIRIWDVAKLMPATAWRTGSEFVSSLTASADGQLLLSTDPNKEINVWNPKTGEIRLTASRSQGFPYLARPGALLVEGKKLITLAGVDSAALELLDLTTGEIVKKIAAPVRITCAQSDRRGQFLLAGFAYPGYRAVAAPIRPGVIAQGAPERTSALQIYDHAGNQLGDGFPEHLEKGVRAAVFSPDATFVASLDESGVARVFNTESHRRISDAKISVPDSLDLAATEDGLLVVGSGLGSLHCFRAATGEAVSVVNQAHFKPIRRLALNPNGKLVATMAEDHQIKLWSLPGLKPLGGFDAPKPEEYTGGILFLDDKTLVAGGVGGIVHLWAISDAIDLAHWNVYAAGAAADAIAISDDGARIALGDASGVLHILDVQNSRELATLAAHSGGVRHVQFTSGSYEVVTKGAQGAPLRWNWEHTSESAPAEGVILSSGRHDPPSALGPNLRLGDGDGVFFDRGQASERFIAISGIQASRIFAQEHWLIVAAPSGIWIIDTERRAIVWGFETPAYTYALALDTRQRELLSSHDDGIVRRWKLPDKGKTLPQED